MKNYQINPITENMMLRVISKFYPGYNKKLYSLKFNQYAKCNSARLSGGGLIFYLRTDLERHYLHVHTEDYYEGISSVPQVNLFIDISISQLLDLGIVQIAEAV